MPYVRRASSGARPADFVRAVRHQQHLTPVRGDQQHLKPVSRPDASRPSQFTSAPRLRPNARSTFPPNVSPSVTASTPPHAAVAAADSAPRHRSGTAHRSRSEPSTGTERQNTRTEHQNRTEQNGAEWRGGISPVRLGAARSPPAAAWRLPADQQPRRPFLASHPGVKRWMRAPRPLAARPAPPTPCDGPSRASLHQALPSSDLAMTWAARNGDFRPPSTTG